MTDCCCDDTILVGQICNPTIIYTPGYSQHTGPTGATGPSNCIKGDTGQTGATLWLTGAVSAFEIILFFSKVCFLKY
jgi:hypothetical protein